MLLPFSNLKRFENLFLHEAVFDINVIIKEGKIIRGKLAYSIPVK